MAAIAMHVAQAVGAERNVPVSRPTVFPEALVNVVIMPYSQPGDTAGAATDLGQHLTAIVHRTVLTSLLPLGGIGVVELTSASDGGGRFSAQKVISQLMGATAGAQAQLVPGRGVVFLWGRVYEDAGQVFVQSYARFARREASEDVSVDILGKTFVLRPPVESVRFAPRVVSAGTIAELVRAARADTVLRTKPDPWAPAASLIGKTGMGMGFRVLEVTDGWIRVQSLLSGEEGWLASDVASQPNLLPDLLPETNFVRASVAYLMARIEHPAPSSPRANLIHRQAVMAVAAFEARADAAKEATALSVAHSLLGLMRVQDADADSTAATGAARSFAEAVRYSPRSVRAAENEAIVDLLIQQKLSGGAVSKRGSADALFRAAASDPTDLVAARNVRGYFEVLDSHQSLYVASRADTLSRKEVSRTLAALNPRPSREPSWIAGVLASLSLSPSPDGKRAERPQRVALDALALEVGETFVLQYGVSPNGLIGVSGGLGLTHLVGDDQLLYALRVEANPLGDAASLFVAVGGVWLGTQLGASTSGPTPIAVSGSAFLSADVGLQLCFGEGWFVRPTYKLLLGGDSPFEGVCVGFGASFGGP
jgi:hypothetical protein